jgi:hypothetical protein
VLYEITTGRRAFRGDQTFAIMNKVLAGEIVPPTDVVPDYPERIQELVQWAMALDRDDRPPTAAAWAEAIEQVAAELGLDMRTETLAGEVSARFGDPSPPSLDVVPLRSANDSSSDTRVVTNHAARDDRPRSRLWRTVTVSALVAAGIGVGSLFGWNAARSETVADDAPVPATIASTPTPMLEPDSPAASEAPIAPPELSPHVEKVPPRESTTPAATTSRKSKPIRKQPPLRPRSKSADEPDTKALEPRDGMFPTGMR